MPKLDLSAKIKEKQKQQMGLTPFLYKFYFPKAVEVHVGGNLLDKGSKVVVSIK